MSTEYDDPSTTINEDDIAKAEGGHSSHQDESSPAGAFVLGILGFLVAMIFIPTIIIALLGYSVFRFGHHKRIVIAALGVISSIIGFFVLLSSDIPGFISKLVDFRLLKEQWPQLMQPLGTISIGFGLLVGVWFGLVLVQIQIMRMKKEPWLTTVADAQKWMYHFEFKPTWFETRRRKKIIKEIQNDTFIPYHDIEYIPIGFEERPMNYVSDPTKEKRWQLVSRNENEVVMHTMVTGATGSGKSVTLLSFIKRDIDSGKTIFIIDNKNSSDFASSIAHMSKEHGSNFYHFFVGEQYRIVDNPDGPASYDPLAHGSVSIKTDMLLGTREWDTSAAVYRENANAYLSKVFSIIAEARKLGIIDHLPQIDTSQGELWTFTQMLNKGIFNSVITAMNQVEGASYIRQIASDLNAMLAPNNRQKDADFMKRAQNEYETTMSGLMSSEYGRWLRGDSGVTKSIDIFKLASESNNVVLFSLDANTSQSRGAFIGSMICNDLSNMSAARGNEGQSNPVSIYIDEFASLPPTCVKSILEKGRAAKTGVTLAFQTLKQVESETGTSAFVTSLLDTCSNFIFHAGSNYDTGLMASKILAMHKVPQYSVTKRNQTRLGKFNYRNNGNLNVSLAGSKDEWVLDPSEFAKLAMPSEENNWKSEAIVIKKNSYDKIDRGINGAVAHKVTVIPPSDVLEKFYDPSIPPMEIDEPPLPSDMTGSIKPDETVKAPKTEHHSEPINIPLHAPEPEPTVKTTADVDHHNVSSKPQTRKPIRPQDHDIDIAHLDDEDDLDLPSLSDDGVLPLPPDDEDDNIDSLPDLTDGQPEIEVEQPEEQESIEVRHPDNQNGNTHITKLDGFSF